MLRLLPFLGLLTALLAVTARAQIVEFRATINATQETTGSNSPATGWAVLLYDIGTNRFDLTVTVNDFAATVAASHIHEGAMGVAGPVVTGLGNETVYQRNGTTLTTTFNAVPYGGSPQTLLRNGAYINLHTAAFPGGEVRGQLIAQPVRLSAVIRGDAAAANPSAAYGAALITYDPGTNKIWTRINVYNFTNTLTNSHYHEAPPGANGPVSHGLGGASVYTQSGTSYGAVFSDQTYGGDPWKLLTGGSYINIHSNVAPAGEIRGQVHILEEFDVPRLVNIAARGNVGTGDNVLISGFVIAGEDPVRVLVTAKGPSLAAFGVSSALANPMLSLHDRTGREIVTNDDFASGFSSGDLVATGFAPTDANEAALILVLPPGVYTSVVSGVGGTSGIALTEAYEVRPAGTSAIVRNGPQRGLRRAAPTLLAGERIRVPTNRGAPEICGASLTNSVATAQ